MTERVCLESVGNIELSTRVDPPSKGFKSRTLWFWRALDEGVLPGVEVGPFLSRRDCLRDAGATG